MNPIISKKNSSFVLTMRNKENSIFHVIAGSKFKILIKSNRESIISSGGEKLRESVIINNIVNKSISYFTYNKIDDSFTKVELDPANPGHIRSINNHTKKDNIENLPVM